MNGIAYFRVNDTYLSPQFHNSGVFYYTNKNTSELSCLSYFNKIWEKTTLIISYVMAMKH